MFTPSSLRRQRLLFLALAALLSTVGLQRGAGVRSATAMASYQLMRVSVLAGVRSVMYGPVHRPDPLQLKVQAESSEDGSGGDWLEAAVEGDDAFEVVSQGQHATLIGHQSGRGGQVFAHLTLRRRNLSTGESWDLSTPTSVGTLAWPALVILALVGGALVATRRRGVWVAPLVAGTIAQAVFWIGAGLHAVSGAGGGSSFSSMGGVGLAALTGRLSGNSTSSLVVILALSCVGVVALRLVGDKTASRPSVARIVGLTICWGSGALAWLDVAARTGAFTPGAGVLGAMAWLSVAAGIGATFQLVLKQGESQ